MKAYRGGRRMVGEMHVGRWLDNLVSESRQDTRRISLPHFKVDRLGEGLLYSTCCDYSYHYFVRRDKILQRMLPRAMGGF